MNRLHVEGDIFVRYLKKGDRYGVGNSLEVDGEPLIEFYIPAEKLGRETDYMISRYYAETILEHSGGLMLDGSTEESVSAKGIKKVQEWVAKL